MNFWIEQTKNPSAIFEVPEEWNPKVGAMVLRAQTSPRYGQAGVVMVGDQEPGERPITFDWKELSENDPGYRAKLNEYFGFMRKRNAPHHLVWEMDNEEALRTEIALSTMADTPHAAGLEYRIGTNTAQLLMLNSFWEDYDAQLATTNSGGLTNEGLLPVTNDCEVEVWPIITISTDRKCEQFTLYNQTNGGAITLANNAFTPLSNYTINCRKGTVYLGAQEMSAAVADGSGMLFLDPGVNVIEFLTGTSAAVEIIVEFRRRYAF